MLRTASAKKQKQSRSSSAEVAPVHFLGINTFLTFEESWLQLLQFCSSLGLAEKCCGMPLNRGKERSKELMFPGHEKDGLYRAGAFLVFAK